MTHSIRRHQERFSPAERRRWQLILIVIVLTICALDVLARAGS